MTTPMTTTENRTVGKATGSAANTAVDTVGAASGRQLSGDAAGAAWARRLARTVLPVLATVVVFLCLWLAVSYLLLTPERREILVPPPQEVLTDSLLQWSHLRPMLAALLLDVEVSMVGLVIAVVLGVLAAVVMSQASWLERGLYPFAILLQVVPILAIVPLIGLWFNYGINGRVVVCVIIAIFPMIANTLFGIHAAEQGAHDLFTLHKASRWQRLTKLQLPGALPSIFAGLRISSGLSVIGALVGDFFFVQGQPGLGTLLSTYIARVQSADLFAAILLSSLYGVAVFAVFTALTSLAVGSWYRGSRARA
ncbi:MAG: NitT/TauT family transport system permease protein [Pseudonocardiales bacterium]|nr:NitT/TauT family transport system permease protein [Pseudonocardiales bacterium]